MDLGRILDALIEPFSPSTAYRRGVQRLALQQVRQYDAAAFGRRTQGWQRPGTSADAEIRRGLVGLRNGSRELVRNNKYAAAAVAQIAAHVIGDGIAPRAVHADEKLAQAAQEAWDDWANSQVDGENDFYGIQALAYRAQVEGGEALLVWGPNKAKSEPDGRIRLLEGDWLDPWKYVERPGAGRIVQGIEFDEDGDRAGYWLFDRHPGDAGGFGLAGGFGMGGKSTRFDAAHVDHLYRQDRPGQTRGVPWLAPAMMTLRELADLEDATLMKKKVEACLALILTPPDASGPAGPFDPDAVAGSAEPGATSDRIKPGMVFRARPGETATTLNPNSSGDGVDFARMQLMGVCANLAPYHFITGDPSQANYSSARALSLPFWANLDTWQQHNAIPRMCATAWRRRMNVQALKTGDRRFTKVGALWAPPMRRQNDPIKDGAGELMEIRAGLKSMAHALTARGLNPKAHLQEIADFNTVADGLRLAFDSDPRRLTDSGILQASAGYLFGGQPNQGN